MLRQEPGAVAVLQALHEPNRHLLCYICRLMHVISTRHTAATKMTSNNLAVVLAPNLVRVDGNPLEEMDLSRCVSVALKQLIDDYDTILPQLSVKRQLFNKQLQDALLA